MPLKLDIRRKLSTRSARVKSMDLHPTEPWLLVSLFSGQVMIWNYESQQKVKTFDVCDVPVRAAKFVARKHWVVTGSDDMVLRYYNYNTLERVKEVDAHQDFIRGIAVHPTQPFVLSCSDDMSVKLWDWEKHFSCTQVFEGHYHYVMQVVINPKDNNTFATASLDRTVKVWQLGSQAPNFTLEGHEAGVNCVGYYYGGDKPYLISGADDRRVKIWDYQNKTCVQTLKGHAHNVSCVAFHPDLPLIITGSEDGTVRIWHANTYRLENTLDYGVDRAWCISCAKGLNCVAMGYDEGSVMIKIGRDEPAISMDSSGKIIWARHSEIQQANVKALGDQDVKDGERLSLAVKDLGSCDIYPQTIAHNPNGRFVVVCGDGEYIIYTAMALRNKSFGSAQEFVWGSDASVYAIRDSSSTIKMFKNFKEVKTFKPDFGTEGIYGGPLIGVRTVNSLSFYDWENTKLIRRIEASPKQVMWNDSGELVCIAMEGSYYVLKYCSDIVEKAESDPDSHTEDGIEDSFDVLNEIEETIKTGTWVGDCLVYTNSVNRLNYYVGGELVTIAHLDRVMFLLGYIPKENRLFLADKDMNVVTFGLLLSVMEYQTAVMRRDFDLADKILPTIPRDQRSRVAHFLESQGFKPQALAVTVDPEHKFELALQLADLKTAYQLAKDAQSEEKWKHLAELATSKGEFGLAQECLHQANDFGGLLLMATSTGNGHMVNKLGETAATKGENNVSFLSYFSLGKVDECLEVLINTGRLPEAAFFARTYLPSQVSRVISLWKAELGKTSPKAAQSLADPAEYENLFPGLQQSLKVEQYLQGQRNRLIPAQFFKQVPPNEQRNATKEMLEAESQGQFQFNAPTAENTDSLTGEPAEGKIQEQAKEEEPQQQQDCKEAEEESPSSPPQPRPLTPPTAKQPETQPAVQQPVAPPAESKSAEKTLEDFEKEIDLDLENLDIAGLGDTAVGDDDIDLDDWE